MKFTYSSGQRPLEGYTIKRGIGRGGFGEVYYALSDGGKEVALKLVCSNLEIELRGMSQCLNLKHPHLVSLFDLRTDDRGDHWVVMEYISGESLSTVLERHPQGVAPELARQWFLDLAGAIGYLHDHGIVHRDLKPGNIFLENGVIKVGDYGLCKFIGGSQRTGQTQSVGTVHYMAPEISTGNYNRQIDIYAAGVILYELLTGHVPFDGESAGEILMKHLTTPPDLSKVPTTFVPILDKALSKNTAHRYRTMKEMAKDVELVGQAAPERPVALPAAIPVGYAHASEPILAALPYSFRHQVAELAGSLILSTVLAALFALLWVAMTKSDDNWMALGRCFFLTVGCTWAVVIPVKWWRSPVLDSWKHRLALMGLGLVIGLEALWLEGFPVLAAPGGQVENGLAEAPRRGFVRSWAWPLGGGSQERFRSGPVNSSGVSPLASYLSYFAMIFFVMRWWKLAEPKRGERFSLFAVVVAAFWAYVFFILLPGGSERQVFFMAVVVSAVIIQLVSPWERPAPVRGKRLRLRYNA
jgi:eukaryotic-like serine/threonine-protein kinase